MLKIRSLQQRLALFFILPVAVFLAGFGVTGYFYLIDILLQQWREAAILRLERAAHLMDMRLMEPIHWMGALAQTGGGRQGEENRSWILQQLEKLPGVSQVKLTWNKPPTGPGSGVPRPVAAVSPLQYLYPPGEKTVELRSDLKDNAGRALGQIEVFLKFEYLMGDLLTEGWMQSNMACLVKENGDYLAHSNPEMASRHCLGETRDPLELAMQKMMTEKPSGTIVGKDEVVGFYRLQEAPWVIMLHARADQILAPFLSFRFYYLAGGLLCLAVILLLIRLGVGPLIFAIRRMSRKATKVAKGEYGEPLPVISQDEIGQLTKSFNAMMVGLEERDFISNTFGRYVDPEIARELLRRPEAARLGGEKREVAILFSDIRGFTPLAETLSPEATIRLLNHHFSRMIEVIRAHHGIIVDFLGDAILAFFDPLDGPVTPVVQEAVRCGLEMQAAQEEVNAAEPAALALKMGVGIHVGEVVVGNIGSESRAKYGIMGSAVNLTHRLQGQAQGGEVVISEAVYRQVQQEVVIQREFHTHLKGIKEPMALYAVDRLPGG